MKAVNPFGVVPSSLEKAGNEVMACMCTNTFSSTRTTHDTCSHCGCSCGKKNYSSNHSTASSTYRVSY